MKNRNLIIGTAAGVAILGATAWYFSKKGKLDWKSLLGSAGSTMSGIANELSGSESETDHGGQQLAEKAKHRAQRSITDFRA
jgi:hypothetical protein